MGGTHDSGERLMRRGSEVTSPSTSFGNVSDLALLNSHKKSLKGAPTDSQIDTSSLPTAQFSSCQANGGGPSLSRLTTTPLVGDTGLGDGGKGAQRGSGNVTGLGLFIDSSKESWPFQGSLSQNKCIDGHFCFPNATPRGTRCALVVEEGDQAGCDKASAQKLEQDCKIKTEKKEPTNNILNKIQ